MKKRITAFLLAVIMIFGVLPANQVLASETTENTVEDLEREKKEAKRIVIESYFLEKEEHQEFVNKINASKNKDEINLIVMDTVKLCAKSKLDRIDSLTFKDKEELKQKVIDIESYDDLFEKIYEIEDESIYIGWKNVTVNTINQSKYLTKQEKQEFIQRAGKATKPSEFIFISKEALDKNNELEKKELHRQRDLAKKEIDTLKYLTNAQKKDFVEQIEQGDFDFLDDIIENAKFINLLEIKEFENDEELSQTRNEASGFVHYFKDMTFEERDKLRAEIYEETNIEILHSTILKGIKLENIELFENLHNLSTTEKIEVEQKIKEQSDAYGVQKVYLEALKIQGNYSIDRIYDLTYSKKQLAKKEINNAKSMQEIFKILEDTRNQSSSEHFFKLDKDQVYSMFDLTDKEKSYFIGLIEQSNNFFENDLIIGEALNLDARNRLDNSNKKRQEIKDFIDGLEYLSKKEKQDFKDRVDGLNEMSMVEWIKISAIELNDENKEDSNKDNSSSQTTDQKTGQNTGGSSTVTTEDTDTTDEVKDSQEEPKFSTVRDSGKDRVETAIVVSKKYFGSSDTVIIVDDSNYPDALTASVLAKTLNAPILLTNSNSLDPRVGAEISRLGAKDIIIIGGNAAISETVSKELEKFDQDQVERIYGSDRYSTSAEVAKKVVELTGEKGHAIVASGENFADALAIAPYASREGLPILLVQKNNLPESIAETIDECKLTEFTITGGEAAVTSELANTLPKVKERISGKTRFETAIEIAKKFSGQDEVFLTNGTLWMDALVIGPVAGKNNQPILLTLKNTPTESLVDFVNSNEIQKITVVGGEAVVEEGVLEKLAK